MFAYQKNDVCHPWSSVDTFELKIRTYCFAPWAKTYVPGIQGDFRYESGLTADKPCRCYDDMYHILSTIW